MTPRGVLLASSLLTCLATPALAQRPQAVAAQRPVAHSLPASNTIVARGVPRPVGGFLLGAVLGAALGFVYATEVCDIRCDDIGVILYSTGVGATIGGVFGVVFGVVTRSRVESGSTG